MRPFSIVAVLVVAIVALAFPQPARGAEAPVRVAVIVGPVGEELTPVYIQLAETAARAAETRGASVARAYSPNATAEAVLAAVEGANIVVYLGHGVGSPNPYSDSPNPATTNGWGLNGPGARGTHEDSWRDGTLAYYGEAWIVEHARPAPGWVMIYSNACYAPGAGEGQHQPATEAVAAARVSAYSRAVLADLGGSGYFATDFYEGAAHLVATLLDNPRMPFGEVFATEERYVADGLTRHAHAGVADAETWLQRSAYFDGKVDYWYAFAGNPAASLALPGSVVAAGVAPLAIDDRAVGMASHYGESVGWEGRATIALPVEIGGGIPDGDPRVVLVCADRCVLIPVVDSCPCYVGTADQRVANLSHEAWRQITDLPLEEGLVRVEIDLSPAAPPATDSPAA